MEDSIYNVLMVEPLLGVDPTKRYQNRLPKYSEKFWIFFLVSVRTSIIMFVSGNMLTHDFRLIYFLFFFFFNYSKKLESWCTQII